MGMPKIYSMRKFMKRILLSSAAVLLAAGVGSVAFGSSVPVSADLTGGVAPGKSIVKVVVHGRRPVGANFVGQIDWTMTSTEFSGDFSGGANAQLSASLSGATHAFSTYCIEGTEDVILGQTATWADGVVTLDNAPDPGDLTKTLDPTQIADLTNLWNLFHDGIGSSDSVKATAFQLAIWEIVDDDRNGLSADGVSLNSVGTGVFGGGTFEAAAGSGPNDGAALTMAGTWLSDVLTDESVTPLVIPHTYTLYALAGKGTQDQIIALATPVPLPAALPAGLALMAALGFGKVIRRRMGH